MIHTDTDIFVHKNVKFSSVYLDLHMKLHSETESFLVYQGAEKEKRSSEYEHCYNVCCMEIVVNNYQTLNLMHLERKESLLLVENMHTETEYSCSDYLHLNPLQNPIQISLQRTKKIHFQSVPVHVDEVLSKCVCSFRWTIWNTFLMFSFIAQSVVSKSIFFSESLLAQI